MEDNDTIKCPDNVSGFFNQFDSDYQNVLMTGKNDAMAIIVDELKGSLNKMREQVEDYVEQASSIIVKVNKAKEQDAHAKYLASAASSNLIIEPGTSDSEAYALRNAEYDRVWRENRSDYWDD